MRSLFMIGLLTALLLFLGLPESLPAQTTTTGALTGVVDFLVSISFPNKAVSWEAKCRQINRFQETVQRTTDGRAVGTRGICNRAQTVQKEPNVAFSFQRFTSERLRNHPFAKPLYELKLVPGLESLPLRQIPLRASTVEIC